MMKKKRPGKLTRCIAVILSLTLIFPGVIFATVEEKISSAVEGQRTLAGCAGESLLDRQDLLPAGSSISDWTAIAFSLAGAEDCYGAYLSALEDYVTACYQEKGILDQNKATEYHRIILTVLALGGDPTEFGDDAQGEKINLVAEGIYNYVGDSLGKQGLNGWIFALIALDAGEYEIPEDARYTREDVLEEILLCQNEDGGFSLSAGSSDVDMTAMALQALAAYEEEEEVEQAVEKALAYLADQISERGTFFSYGSENVESAAQVLIALGALGIDPGEDVRFQALEEGISLFVREDGSYAHDINDEVGDAMATEQTLLALCALQKLRRGEGSIYQLTDCHPVEATENTETAGVLPVVGLAVVLIALGGILIDQKKRKRS